MASLLKEESLLFIVTLAPDFSVSPRYRLHTTCFPQRGPLTAILLLYTYKQKNMANQFLVKETMAAMRGLSATEITALQT
ncbi:MAG: hypothetical protein K0S24_3483 [Sphingobacterium sp.]|jgi:hypothetical protein|nr:hypothetical protein [Sphingobacterium sp.]